MTTDTDYWKIQISTWLKQKKLLGHESLFFEFFTNVFSNTKIPDKAWFGTTKTSISL